VDAQLAKLNQQEDRFLDLVGDPDWPQDKIAVRLRTVRDERDRLTRQLDNTQLPTLETARDTLVFLLDLLAEPHDLYRRSSAKARRVLNQAFFTRIYLDADDDGSYVASDELTEIIEPLVDVARRPQYERRRPHGRRLTCSNPSRRSCRREFE
jgi:site-specific DNA recombinase